MTLDLKGLSYLTAPHRPNSDRKSKAQMAGNALIRMKILSSLLTLGIASIDLCTSIAAPEMWHPAEGPLKTRWAKDVSPEQAHPEYPRPQMIRAEWLNLNGLWDYAITTQDAPSPQKFDGRILVPFPVESALSGVMKSVDENSRLWYRRKFTVPRNWGKQRVLLHFGAVDFEATAWVNGLEVGQHRGGYDPFSFDITGALKAVGLNEMVVSVWDPTDAGTQARGKQVRKPDQGIFYTSTTGIWQTVWLEPVPEISIENLKLTPDIDGGVLRVTVQARGASDGAQVEVISTDLRRRAAGSEIREGQIVRARGKAGAEIIMLIQNVRLWSPDDPFLYDLRVTLVENGRKIDSVKSYFGMRKISLGKDEKGVTRIFLNNKPCFMLGPLDQGFWPDGLYTAPTDQALRFDIEATRKLGFNMARKHVKVEPERWYYWADKLGLLVWQDMPSGDKFIRPQDPDITRTPASAEQFEKELKALVETHYNHPSIVMWVIFNEGWGQYDTPRLTQWIKELDPSRLANHASGWSDRGVGDVHDMHKYPGPGAPQPEPNRAAVLGEFGGLGLKVEGHTWAQKTWGYRGMPSAEKLIQQYVKLLRGVWALKDAPGLSAAVYTQTTDVEYEANGLMTYDRAVTKMLAPAMMAANRGQLPPPPQITAVIPTAQNEPAIWRYTTEKPEDAWFRPQFEAHSWKEGPAGFGTAGTPGAVVRTEWKTSDIWLRREFKMPNTKLDDLHLLLHHDEDAEVYINGVLAAKVQGYTSDYEDFEISSEAKKALNSGTNVMAVHCHQTGGGQYIDVGIVNFSASP